MLAFLVIGDGRGGYEGKQERVGVVVATIGFEPMT